MSGLYPHEDTIDDLHQELGQARRAYESHLRAPSEGRWADGWALWERRKRATVQRLERELADAQAVLRAEEDALAADQGDAA